MPVLLFSDQVLICLNREVGPACGLLNCNHAALLRNGGEYQPQPKSDCSCRRCSEQLGMNIAHRPPFLPDAYEASQYRSVRLDR